MISKQMFSLNFTFLCSLIEELCIKEENYKIGCNFNFEHQCTYSNYARKGIIFNNSENNILFLANFMRLML